MNDELKDLYVYILGRRKSPKQMFSDWNKFKLACSMAKVDRPEGNRFLYPKYVRMAIKYRATNEL